MYVDQSVIAEGFAFLDRGVVDGSEADITRYYGHVKSKDGAQLPSAHKLIAPIERAVGLLADLAGEPIVQRPHFLMLLAALMYASGDLPESKLITINVPNRHSMLTNEESIRQSLWVLNSALVNDQEGGRLVQFREARASTQRMKSRQVRFEHFCHALTGGFA